jgi:hypothetical protein
MHRADLASKLLSGLRQSEKMPNFLQDKKTHTLMCTLLSAEVVAIKRYSGIYGIVGAANIFIQLFACNDTR